MPIAHSDIFSVVILGFRNFVRSDNVGDEPGILALNSWMSSWWKRVAILRLVVSCCPCAVYKP